MNNRAIGEKLQTEVKNALTGDGVLSQEACWRIPDAPYASSKRPFDLIGVRYEYSFAIECKRTEQAKMSTSVLKGHQRLELARFQLAVGRQGVAAIAVDVGGWKALVPIWAWMRMEARHETLGVHCGLLGSYTISEHHLWHHALSGMASEASSCPREICNIVRTCLADGR